MIDAMTSIMIMIMRWREQVVNWLIGKEKGMLEAELWTLRRQNPHR